MKKNNKVIVLIGSSGLIGNKLCNFFINNSYIVVMADLKKNKDSSIIKNHSIFVKTNITNESSIKKLINITFKKFKKIDVVINCAYPKTKNWATTFINSSSTDLKKDLFNQIGSAILISRNFYSFFKKQGYGNVIMLSSIQSIKSPVFSHYKNTKMVSPIEYSAIKSGIIAIVKYMAKYSKNSNIRFNTISPGGIFNNQPKKFLTKYKKDCLNKGMLDPEDLISAFEFLIDDKSKYVNGQNIVVDDGWGL